MGIPTSSQFKTVIAKGKNGTPSLTRRKYLYRLAGELITGEPSESFSNVHTDRGHEMEPEARGRYAFINDVEIQRVGFIRRDAKGCSPDGLVGNNGMLEIKTALPDVLIDHLLSDGFPSEHVAQCQGALWVAEREWIDICIYWPRMPTVIRRAYRDEPYIKQLSDAVDQFNSELAELVERIRKQAA